MTRRTSAQLSVALLLVGLTVASGLSAQRPAAAEAERLIETLALGPGDVVADIGAGAGDMTFALARTLGPQSRIFATEIDRDRLRQIREAAAAEGLENVVVLEAHAVRTNLPEACCDAIFVRRVYHHFRDPAAMNASIRAALKPGGRFAVIDFPPRREPLREVAPEDRACGDAHGVSPEAAVEELRKAGFENVRIETHNWPSGMFLVLATRPMADEGPASSRKP